MRVGELFEALKMRALPESGYGQLLDFLKLFRDAAQLVLNELWNRGKFLSRSSLHRLFYGELRKLGFRAHHAKQIYSYALALYKSARRNSGSKSVLKRLAARLDKYDYKLDLKSKTLVLKLHNGYEARLRLLASDERIRKYIGL